MSCHKDPQTCTDDLLNQDEINVDCGGTCLPCALEYPANGSFGTNILDTTTFNFVSVPAYYSLRVEVPVGSSFRAVFKNTSAEPGNDVWFYLQDSDHNLEVSEYDWSTNTQEFTSVSSGDYSELRVEFMGMGNTHIGGVEISIYENGATSPTRVKQIQFTF